MKQNLSKTATSAVAQIKPDKLKLNRISAYHSDYCNKQPNQYKQIIDILDVYKTVTQVLITKS